MLKFSNKIFRALKVSYMFEEAWDRIARGDVNSAENIFEAAESEISSIDFEQKIQKGYIKFKLNKHYECIEAFRSAWEEIDNSKSISNVDKLYLREYMYGILKIYENFLDLDISFSQPVLIDEIPLRAVSKKWKRRFPSRDYPDWDKYGV